MERSLLKPFLSVVVLMTISVFSLAFTVGVKLDHVPGVKMKLPTTVGSWVGNGLRYCHNEDACDKNYACRGFFVNDLEIPDICPDCGEKLYNMSRAEYEQLPKDTEFVKSSYTNASGARVFASVVLSGTARNSIHRPQRCLKGQGNLLDGEYTLEIPLEGRDPLKVRVIKTHRVYKTADGAVTQHGYYAYWFVGQDRETPYHLGRMFWLAWDRVVRSTANRWAYIAVSGEREEEGTAYEAEISDFAQSVYPYLLTDSMKKKVYGQ